MTQATEDAIMKVVWSLITAAIVGLSGWAYAVGNRVSVVEERVSGLKDTLSEVKSDVKETKHMLQEVLGK